MLAWRKLLILKINLLRYYAAVMFGRALKSVENISPVHKKQLLTYLRLADMRLGLLINFGAVLIRDGISRVVNNLQE